MKYTLITLLKHQQLYMKSTKTHTQPKLNYETTIIMGLKSYNVLVEFQNMQIYKFENISNIGLM